ncbi:hypothetical protein THAOC_03477 [Thalassiosira oceanica]|uniref:Uncharacterized protein n=1 Tax=Thalassiosira oceanica TaxID=159749 RepID=K0T7R6_THAOC|nr:hypothetical protein THAOC_03477 [Thalassiosira oceanica]|eukprot:EJK74823.1 hypothetical protein THAOC_03477 [Thalassiosira oceanica]
MLVLDDEVHAHNGQQDERHDRHDDEEDIRHPRVTVVASGLSLFLALDVCLESTGFGTCWLGRRRGAAFFSSTFDEALAIDSRDQTTEIG